MWQKIIQFFQRLDLRIAVKTAIAAGCSFYVASVYSSFFSRPDIIASGLWCVVASVVVMQANIGGTYKAGAIRFMGSIIGSVIGAISCYYFAASPATLGLNVAATILVCSILQLQEAYRIAALSASVVMLSWAIHSDLATPWEIGFFRSLDASVGIIIAIIVSHMVWPEQTWVSIQNHFIQSIQIAKVYFHEAVEIPAPKTEDPKIELENEKGRNEELEELLDLLTKLRGEINEVKLDIFSFSNKGNDWLLIIRDLDILVEAIAIVEEIPKDNFNNIFDESLKWHLDGFIEECDRGFNTIQSICLKISSPHIPERSPEVEQLFTKELERFRQTYITRNFSLTDVENLYSYFYHLRYIAKLLRKIKQELLI